MTLRKIACYSPLSDEGWVRVIAGSHKGRRLLSSQGLAIRPTSGRVKEALFSIIGERINGAVFLDLYAGTGAIGIEALSRGARQAVFVEVHPASQRFLKKNVNHCGFSSQAIVRSCSAEDFLERNLEAKTVFDIVFADPPYHVDAEYRLLPSLEQSVMIADQTIVLVEHPARHRIPPRVGRLRHMRRYQYGDTALSKFVVRV